MLVVSGLVAGVAGFAVVSLRAPRYEASVQLLVGPINTDLDTIRAAGQLAQTYAQIATSQPLLDAAAKQLGVRVVRGDVRSTANDVTRVVTVRVRSGSAVRAAAVANSLGDQLAALAARGTSRPEGELQVIDRASPPLAPDAANAVLLAVLAGLAGLLGSFTIVLLVEYLRNTVASGQELAELAGVGLLGSLAGGRRAGGLVVEAEPDSAEASAYRLLATEVEFSVASSGERGLRSLLVLGAQGGEGAGEVAANLACALVAAGRRVTVVDANLLEGELTRLLGFSERLGMGELARHAELLERGDEVLRHFQLSHASGIEVLPRGGQAGGELVEPLRVRQLLERLLEESDLVVVTAAPLHRSPGALVWARSVDGTLLVAAKDQTRRERVSRAVESLRLVGATLTGTILNGRGAGLRKESRGPSRTPSDVVEAVAGTARAEAAERLRRLRRSHGA